MVPRPVVEAVILAASACTGVVIVGSFLELDRLRKQLGDIVEILQQQVCEIDDLTSKLESLKKN